MSQQITSLSPAIPATTAIQDPAARRFAAAVTDALRAQQSKEYAIAQLDRAAQALNASSAKPGTSTSAAVQTWLASSPVYQKLTSAIEKVDIAAKQAIISESLARQEAVATLTTMIGSGGGAAAEYDPLTTYAVGEIVVYGGSLYMATQGTTGNLPSNPTYWEKIGDYASVGAALAAYAARIYDLETDVSNYAGDLTAEIQERETLATQLRGDYAGTNIDMITSGLIHSERTARVSAIEATTSTLETQISQIGDISEAAILAEASTRATNDNALVDAVNTMWAITGVNEAISQSGTSLITNWTTAEANYWTTLDAEVFTAGGQTIRAALAEEASVRAEFEGNVQATWTIRADVDGYVAGIGLGVYGTPGGITSDFIVRADKFAVVMPGYDDFVPFAVGPFGMSFEGTTHWAQVDGPDKPEDNATVGAPAGTMVGGVEASTLATAILDVGSDNKLTPVEKQAVRKEWDAIEAEYTGIAAQAITLGVGYATYTTTRAALGTYLNNGTAWSSGPPDWISDANLETTTTIVGATFRQKFSDFYAARQALLNSIATAASQKATWSGVTGAGKPEDNATNGATIGYNLLKQGGGYVFASDFVATWNQMTSANISTYMANAAIDTALIKNAAITRALIANLAVGSAQIDNLAVGSAQIGDLSVGGKKLKPPTSGSIYVPWGNFRSVWHGMGRIAMVSIYKVVLTYPNVDLPSGYQFGRDIVKVDVTQYDNYFDIRNESSVVVVNAIGTEIPGSINCAATIYFTYM